MGASRETLLITAGNYVNRTNPPSKKILYIISVKWNYTESETRLPAAGAIYEPWNKETGLCGAQLARAQGS
jgi:hypothetical protein